MKLKLPKVTKPDPSLAVIIGAATVAIAAATAFWVELRARRIERRYPPRGRIITVDGIPLHYVERGTGPAVVLIHGNLVTLDDMDASGLIGRLAVDHRVIAFDRPGYGHSPRPRDRLWTPTAQAHALHEAMRALGVEQAVVVGHSMGALVATSLALDYPDAVSRLVVIGGYYYPKLRLDALLIAPNALPVVGDVLRYTATAVASRMSLKLAVKAMFAPKEAPSNYLWSVPREMLVRPQQLRANAEDATFMTPAASKNAKRYGELRMPVVIIAGADDAIVDPDDHAVRLHKDVAGSELVIAPGVGHMAHHDALDEVIAAVG